MQITDCHLADDRETMIKHVNPYNTLRHVLAQVSNEAPDIIIGTGDLSEKGSIASYQLLQSQLEATKVPYLLLPGNHDLIENLVATFGDKVCNNKLVSFQDWDLICLNSVVPEKHYGNLPESTLKFLEEQLLESKKFIAIFVHHHPLEIPNQFMNKYKIQNSQEFREIIEPYAHKIKFVAFGHIHQGFEQIFHGIAYYGSPSTSMQFAESTDKLRIDLAQYPGYRMFYLKPNGIFETYINTVNSPC